MCGGEKPPALAERDKVKRGSDADAVYLPKLQCSKRLTKTLIEEALTLSDLFGLSELASAELLVEAEEEYPGNLHGFLNRAPIRRPNSINAKTCANNLKTLVLARSGRTWQLDENMPADIASFRR